MVAGERSSQGRVEGDHRKNMMIHHNCGLHTTGQPNLIQLNTYTLSGEPEQASLASPWAGLVLDPMYVLGHAASASSACDTNIVVWP